MARTRRRDSGRGSTLQSCIWRGDSELVAWLGGSVRVAHLAEYSVKLLSAIARRTLAEVFPGHQRGHLLGESRRDQLVDRDVLTLG
jgi:hypothetical protein